MFGKNVDKKDMEMKMSLIRNDGDSNIEMYFKIRKNEIVWFDNKDGEKKRSLGKYSLTYP